MLICFRENRLDEDVSIRLFLQQFLQRLQSVLYNHGSAPPLSRAGRSFQYIQLPRLQRLVSIRRLCHKATRYAGQKPVPFERRFHRFGPYRLKHERFRSFFFFSGSFSAVLNDKPFSLTQTLPFSSQISRSRFSIWPALWSSESLA